MIIEGDRIVEITRRRVRADFTGVVTPAFIDARSHIGMWRQGEPGDESEAKVCFSELHTSVVQYRLCGVP